MNSKYRKSAILGLLSLSSLCIR